MTRRWPDTLTTPVQPGFSLTPVDPTLRSQMEVPGLVRTRRLTLPRMHSVQMQWLFTDVEMAAFVAWWYDRPWSLLGDSTSLGAWGLTAATLGVDNAIGPDLELADKLIDTAATSGHFAQLSLGATAVGGSTLWGAVTVKAAGRGFSRIGFLNRAGTLCLTDINLTTGALTTQSGLTTRSVLDRGNGWWRVTIVAPAGTGGANPQMRVATMAADNTPSYLGNAVDGILVGEINAHLLTGYDLFVQTGADGKALGAGGNSAWVELPVPLGGGYRYVECQFKGTFKAQATAGLNWQVSAEVVTRDV